MPNPASLEGLTEYERSTVVDALKRETYVDGEVQTSFSASLFICDVPRFFDQTLHTCSTVPQVIIKEGDPGDCFHIVESGNCVCLKASSGDKPVMEISAGSYFGEIAILMDKPRQATIVAVGEVHTLTLGRKTFKVTKQDYTSTTSFVYFMSLLLPIPAFILQRVMGPLEEILKRDMSKYNSVMAQHI